MGFARSGFAQFLVSGAGRAIRVIAGFAIIWWGFSNRESTAGFAALLIGTIPLAAGLFDFCLLSRLFGGPLSGAEIRARGPA